jgi:hypothetical protein
MKNGKEGGEDLRKKAERLRDVALEELRRRGVPEDEIKEIRTGIKERPKTK